MGEASRVRPGNFEDLAALRARHFGFTLDFVARRTGLQPERLRAIEAGDDPTVYELDRVAAVYGIEDADVLLGAPIQLPLGDSLTLLAQHAEFREVSNETRAQLLTASQAARDVVALRAILGEPDAAAILQKRARPSAPKRRATPFDEGARRAHWLRTEELAVGSEPIPSMRDLVAERFPEITTLYAHLGLDGVAGLAFGDRVRGPTIVLNLDGKNTNPLVRRFSLAHELARLLFDWNRAEPFGQLSGFKDDGRLTVEQSANAFAIRTGVAKAP